MTDGSREGAGTAKEDCHGAIRVLVVSKWLDVGGAERFVSTVLRGLDDDRFELQLVLFRNIVGYPLRDHIPVNVLMRSRTHRPWHVLPMIVRLARVIDRTGPDVVLSAYAYPSFIVGMALRIARTRPKWLARVASNPEWEESGLRRPMMRFAYRRVDRFVANSARLAEQFATIYPRAQGRIAHLPNPADFAWIDQAATEPPRVAAPSRPRLVAVGRLAPQKRVDLLLEALQLVHAQFDVELVLCGDGPLRADIEHEISERGLGSAVTLVGYGNPFPWLATADLFLLGSDHEGSPNALIEAQGLGIPAVATDCPFGPSEIVIDGVTGWLVPVGDAIAMSEAIIRALGDPTVLQRAAANARAHARRSFSMSTVCEQLALHLEAVSRET